jgi:ABC-type multidrug transport system ATPase subunit
MAIEARGLGKSYGQNWALRGVDLDVAASEVVAVFGANGAGKSTLLGLLGTLFAPSCGTVHILGRDAIRDPQLVRGAIGVMMHQSYLYAELTAAENLVLYARLYGLPDVKERVRDALGSVGLLSVAGSRVRELSRGLQQRLALARCTIHKPAVLLLDEPESGLDAEGSRYLSQLIAAGRERGQATVLATHQVELGLTLAQRVVILEGGKIARSVAVCEQSPAEWRALYNQSSLSDRPVSARGRGSASAARAGGQGLPAIPDP